MAIPRRGATCPSIPPLISSVHHRHYRIRLGIWQILLGLAIFLASTRQAVVEAACPSISFLFPIPDQTFRALDTIVTSYRSSVETSTMFLWCTTGLSGGPSSANRQLGTKSARPNNNTLEMQLPDSAVGEKCWFILRPDQPDCQIDAPKLQSPQFKVVAASGNPQTIGLAANTVNSVSSPGANSEDSNGGGLPIGTQIGIGVGVSIVVGLLVGGLAVYLYLRRHQRNTDGPSQQSRGWRFPKIVWQRPNPEKRASEGPRPLLNRKDSARTDSANFSDTTRPSAVSNFSSYSPPHGPIPQDDSFYVGNSENLPGFYGSARCSGTKHDVWGPSQYDPEAYLPYQHPTFMDPPKQPHVPRTPGEGMNKIDPPRSVATATPVEYVTPIEYYPPEKGTGDSFAPAATFQPSAATARPPSLCEPDAELPGKEVRGYGQEFELPTQKRPQPYMPGGSAASGLAGPGPGAAAAMAARREAQEQKFLLEDVELMGLKKKREPRPPDPKKPD